MEQTRLLECSHLLKVVMSNLEGANSVVEEAVEAGMIQVTIVLMGIQEIALTAEVPVVQVVEADVVAIKYLLTRSILKLTKGKERTANSTYPKGGVSCSKDRFLVNETFILLINICSESSALRVAATR